MSVNNIGSSSPVTQITSNPIQKSIPTDPPKNIPATDRLELSGASHLLAALKSTDVRTDKVASIRAGSRLRKGHRDTAATENIKKRIYFIFLLFSVPSVPSAR
jgi:hypothetical protein